MEADLHVNLLRRPNSVVVTHWRTGWMHSAALSFFGKQAHADHETARMRNIESALLACADHQRRPLTIVSIGERSSCWPEFSA